MSRAGADREWTEADLRALRKARERGLTFEQIGKRLQRTPAAVVSIMHRRPDIFGGGPPSQAAIRLAQFDPLMRECLERRGYATSAVDGSITLREPMDTTRHHPAMTRRKAGLT